MQLEKLDARRCGIIYTIITPPHIAISRPKTVDEVHALRRQVLLGERIVIERHDVQLFYFRRGCQLQQQVETCTVLLPEGRQRRPFQLSRRPGTRALLGR